MERLGLDERTLLFGARSDVMELPSAADVFVLNPAWEGLRLGRLEALSAGFPVVATRGDGEEVALGDSGPLVLPRDAGALAQAILRLCEDPDLRQGMAEPAARSAERFDDGAGSNRTLAGIPRGFPQ